MTTLVETKSSSVLTHPSNSKPAPDVNSFQVPYHLPKGGKKEFTVRYFPKRLLELHLTDHAWISRDLTRNTGYGLGW